MKNKKLELHQMFGPVISDDESSLVLNEVLLAINKQEKITLDFNKVIAMTTKGAKQIFGKFYLDLGREKFYNQIIISNATETIREIIYDSILNSIKDSEVTR